MAFRSDVNAFLYPSFELVTLLFNYFACFPIHDVIVLAHMICYGQLVCDTHWQKLCWWLS